MLLGMTVGVNDDDALGVVVGKNDGIIPVSNDVSCLGLSLGSLVNTNDGVSLGARVCVSGVPEIEIMMDTRLMPMLDSKSHPHSSHRYLYEFL